MNTWLTRCIATGIKSLVPLSLDRMPANDMLPRTVAAWEKALNYLGEHPEHHMAPRIARAFQEIAENATRWPTPGDLKKHIPDSPPEDTGNRHYTAAEIAERRIYERLHWERMNEMGMDFNPVYMSMPPGQKQVKL
jgi:hypothetical protein